MKKQNNNSGSAKLSLKQQYHFFIMLGDLVQNGFSIRDAIEFIDALKVSPLISKILIDRLQQGHSFATSIRPMIRDDMYYQILVSEEHGQLLSALAEIRELVEFRYQHRNQIQSILAYPIFLILCLILIMIGSQFFILPQIQQFNSDRSSIPSFNYWWLLVGGGILLIVIFLALRFRQLSKLHQVRIIIRIPLIGSIFRHYYSYYLISNLSLMIKSGLDTKAIFSVVNHFDPHSLLYQLGLKISEQVQSGVDLKQAIQDEILLPNELNVFIAKGDIRNKLANELSAFAKISFQRMHRDAKKLISWIQPLMFVVIGIGILLTYLSMLMPMYHSLQGGY